MLSFIHIIARKFGENCPQWSTLYMCCETEASNRSPASLQCLLIPFSNILPVNNVPDILQIIRAYVLVLQRQATSISTQFRHKPIRAETHFWPAKLCHTQVTAKLWSNLSMVLPVDNTHAPIHRFPIMGLSLYWQGDPATYYSDRQIHFTLMCYTEWRLSRRSVNRLLDWLSSQRQGVSSPCSAQATSKTSIYAINKSKE
jgi:hypothetical protein